MKTHIIDNPAHLPLAIYNLLFFNARVVYRGKQVKRQIVTMKAGGTIKKAKIGDFLYLEQNPNKNSKNGDLAKAGHKIMWIIYEPSTEAKLEVAFGNKTMLFEPGKYVAKVVDGQAERLV